jgi:hypothetical protein
MARIDVEWLEGNVNIILAWLATSRDLSPIELLWALLKKTGATNETRDNQGAEKCVISGLVSHSAIHR